MRAEDRIGKVYGRLTVKGVGRNEAGLRTLLCDCACGKSCAVVVGNVASGATKSCGCLRDEVNRPKSAAVVGKRFGRLRVLSVDPSGGKAATATCVCDCGKKCERQVASLNTRSTSSCGCRMREVRQRINRARAKKYRYQGKTLTLSEWAKVMGVSRQAMYLRVEAHGTVAPPTRSEP